MKLWELLEEQVWQDIAQAYNVSRDAIEELKEPAHRQLDTETLSYLFELLRERPAAASKKLCGIAKEAGLDIPENAVSSYRKRLKSLNIILGTKLVLLVVHAPQESCNFVKFTNLRQFCFTFNCRRLIK